MILSAVRTGWAYHLTRVFICLLGFGAICWGLFTLPSLWRESSPRSVAVKLLDGEEFNVQSLLAQAQQAEKFEQYRVCHPAALHSLFILRLFILNQSIAAANQAEVNSLSPRLYGIGREVLACAPTDSFVWVTLFWLDAGRYGLNARNTDYLRLSYTMGPNEGWIALWRLRLAFAVFDRLPADVSEKAADEFAKLVNSGQYYSQTADIFKDASLNVQNRTIERLTTASLTSRRIFAIYLHDRGIDVDIPGIEKSEARPWR